MENIDGSLGVNRCGCWMELRMVDDSGSTMRDSARLWSSGILACGWSTPNDRSICAHDQSSDASVACTATRARDAPMYMYSIY